MTAQPVVQSVAVQAPYPTIYSGVNQQLTAIAQFSDGTQVNVTNTAEWSSSEPQVGGVGQTGILNTSSPGSTTVSAAFSGVSATQNIKVVSPVYHLNAAPSISKDGNGNYVVQLTFTNSGNVALMGIGVTVAQLNSVTAPLPAPIASLAPGASASVQLVFPVSAGADQSTGLLRIGAKYLAVTPGGASQWGTLAENYRLVLP